MIAILGGGISGLAAAYQLKKENKDFVLLEANGKLGGKVGSYQQNGFTCELGPNTVLFNKAEVKDLLEDLGLWNSILFPEEKAIKSRFVLKNGKIEAIPTSFSSAVKSKLVGLNTLFSILKEPLISKRKENSEESLADFSRRRFGNQIYDDFITPFVTGIYAGDPEKMSVIYTLGLLKEAEDKHGSVLKGMIKLMKAKKLENESAGLPKQKVFSLPNGLQDLIDAISERLKDSAKTNCKVTQVEKKNKEYLIHYEQTGEKKTLRSEKVISALPANILADLLKSNEIDLSHQLKQINYANAVVLHLGFNKKDLAFHEAAFGILSRKEEEVPFLGILFNSRFFPHTSNNPEQELITVICGGSRYPELIDKSETEIFEELLPSLTRVLGISGTPVFSNLIKWHQGIPQYELGYASVEKAILEFQDENPNFFILGNYYKGISVSDCIKNAIHLAKKI